MKGSRLVQMAPPICYVGTSVQMGLTIDSNVIQKYTKDKVVPVLF
jgi:hypothetical protein